MQQVPGAFPNFPLSRPWPVRRCTAAPFLGTGDKAGSTGSLRGLSRFMVQNLCRQGGEGPGLSPPTLHVQRTVTIGPWQLDSIRACADRDRRGGTAADSMRPARSGFGRRKRRILCVLVRALPRPLSTAQRDDKKSPCCFGVVLDHCPGLMALTVREGCRGCLCAADTDRPKRRNDRDGASC